MTRPDIVHIVSVVNQPLAAPRTSHWDAVIRVLQYLKRAPSRGRLYSDYDHGRVVGFSDADWVGSPIDRRFTTGYYVFVGENLVSSKNKKQYMVSRFSAEFKYRAMANATCELF